MSRFAFGRAPRSRRREQVLCDPVEYAFWERSFDDEDAHFLEHDQQGFLFDVWLAGTSDFVIPGGDEAGALGVIDPGDGATISDHQVVIDLRPLDAVACLSSQSTRSRPEAKSPKVKSPKVKSPKASGSAKSKRSVPEKSKASLSKSTAEPVKTAKSKPKKHANAA